MINSTLSEIEKNNYAIIKQINCDKILKTRLFDLGLIEGTKIKCVNIAMKGSPLAFNIRGTIIALRKSDCKNILVNII